MTPGNFSYYLENKEVREQRVREFITVAAKIPAKRVALGRKRTFKEQRELEGVEEAIQEAEARVKEIETELNDPGLYMTRAAEVPKLIEQLKRSKEEITRLYNRWAELEQLPTS